MGWLRATGKFLVRLFGTRANQYETPRRTQVSMGKIADSISGIRKSGMGLA
jgi:hypothetical protein